MRWEEKECRASAPQRQTNEGLPGEKARVRWCKFDRRRCTGGKSAERFSSLGSRCSVCGIWHLSSLLEKLSFCNIYIRLYFKRSIQYMMRIPDDIWNFVLNVIRLFVQQMLLFHNFKLQKFQILICFCFHSQPCDC